MENSTPPIGDPKATATPAALAAVIISRILPKDDLSVFLLRQQRATILTLAS